MVGARTDASQAHHPAAPTASRRFREDRMLASLGIATCLVDATEPDLPLAYVNPAFEELTGYPALRCSAATAASCRASTPTRSPSPRSAPRSTAARAAASRC